MTPEMAFDGVLDGSEDEVPDEVIAAELVADESDPGEIETLRAESIEIVRDLLLKTHPDLLPELVQGETLTELLESVGTAEQIFRRVAEVIDARRAIAKPPMVPAGGTGSRVPIDHLSGDGLIRAALQRR
jgi:hypothetical protein